MQKHKNGEKEKNANKLKKFFVLCSNYVLVLKVQRLDNKL